MEYVEVQDAQVPALGFGTWQLEGKKCREAVKDALDIGYRHIDTAQAYRNESEVGKAIDVSGVARENIWLTTKIWRNNLTEENLKRSVEESLERLGTNYVDLLLIHWPFPEIDIEVCLREMEKLVEEGKAFNIGVSNFTSEQLQDVIDTANKPVLTDQVEYHPFLNQDKLLSKCRENNVMLTAYSPLARGDVLGNNTMKDIGDRYEKTEAQIALRWLIQQKNVCAIPKAASKEHRKQNFNIFDFELDSKEMEKIRELGRDERKLNPEFAPDW